jgi:hypothetical protein
LFQDNEEVTPTMKVKKATIEKRYGDIINRLYKLPKSRVHPHVRTLLSLLTGFCQNKSSSRVFRLKNGFRNIPNVLGSTMLYLLNLAPKNGNSLQKADYILRSNDASGSSHTQLEGNIDLKAAIIIVIDMLEDAVKPFALSRSFRRLTGLQIAGQRTFAIPVVFCHGQLSSRGLHIPGKDEGALHPRHQAARKSWTQLEQRDQDIYRPETPFQRLLQDRSRPDASSVSGRHRGDHGHQHALVHPEHGYLTPWPLIFNTYIIKDCCTSYYRDAHDATVKVYQKNPLHPLFQIIDADTFISEYEKCPIRLTTS